MKNIHGSVSVHPHLLILLKMVPPPSIWPYFIPAQLSGHWHSWFNAAWIAVRGWSHLEEKIGYPSLDLKTKSKKRYARVDIRNSVDLPDSMRPSRGPQKGPRKGPHLCRKRSKNWFELFASPSPSSDHLWFVFSYQWTFEFRLVAMYCFIHVWVRT